jgi:hypothetical protein
MVQCIQINENICNDTQVFHTHSAIVLPSSLALSGDKPTEKRPSGSPRRKWEDNIRMDLK